MMKIELSRRSALMQASAGIAAAFVGITPTWASPDCVAAIEHLVGPFLDDCMSMESDPDQPGILVIFDQQKFSAEVKRVNEEFGPAQVLGALENMPSTTRAIVRSYGG